MASAIKVIVAALVVAFCSLPVYAQVRKPASEQVEPHDFRGHGYDCRTCHESVGLRTRGRMLKPVGEICAACHRLPEQSHPVDIKPSMMIPADLRLDEQGRMTCATCHDPHRPYMNPQTGTRTKYLRRDGPNRMLCLACHKQ
jgi:cytochrome c peroxidase